MLTERQRRHLRRHMKAERNVIIRRLYARGTSKLRIAHAVGVTWKTVAAVLRERSE